MKKCRLQISTLLLSSLVMIGCETTSERMCDGFTSPLAEVWTANNGLGEVRTFTDLAGNRRSYLLQSIDRTLPGVTSGLGSDPDLVNCVESAEYLYVDSNADIAFEFDFVQNQGVAGQLLENQRVQLKFEFQNPVGIDADQGPQIRFELDDLTLNNLSGSATNVATNPLSVEFLPEATVNDEIFINLLELTYFDNNERFTENVDEEAQWVRIVIAEGIGLLQYELLNGTVYTLTRE